MLIPTYDSHLRYPDASSVIYLKTASTGTTFEEAYGYDDEFERHLIDSGCFLSGNMVFIQDDKTLFYIMTILNY